MGDTLALRRLSKVKTFGKVDKRLLDGWTVSMTRIQDIDYLRTYKQVDTNQ